MCETDQPLSTPEPPRIDNEPPASEPPITGDPPPVDELPEASEPPITGDQPPPCTGKIEISKEETQDLLEQLAEFAEWAGFNEDLRQTTHILVLCLHSDRPLYPDLAQLSSLVGCTREFAARIMDRVREQEIFKSFDWPNEGGEVSLMLDAMVAFGVLERRFEGEESDAQYRVPADAPLQVGDYVKHKSGFGSGWFIAAEKRGEDNQQFVQLKKSRNAPDDGVRRKWRDASNYVRT